ncbi:protein obstructor-E [Folsomia candida]|uniref:Peritrophin-44 n=1 Tax=Folsomia candida TaxID=158441 RepID=A0A226ENU4_FOLCA|nr:protein obstructor-E [Folsomia candida]OXA58807.1 Peritrophin-44 [Folsomia candida]
MKLLVVGIIPLIVSLIGILQPASSTNLQPCVPSNKSYSIGDSDQCDKYYSCTKAGQLADRLCDDGFVYSLEISACDYPHNVNCSERPLLQPTKSTHPNCPRSNGFYAFPAATSCQSFYHCLEGQAYEKTCPEGVIFDPSKGSCIHPDMSKRPECAAKEVLHFTCPNSLNRFAKLRFGDHDRHSHPDDCRKFLICLKSGKPRVGGCPKGRVFNGETGFCDKPEAVKGCTDYYGKANIQDLIEDSDEPEDFDFDGDLTNNGNFNQKKPANKNLAKTVVKPSLANKDTKENEVDAA